MVDHSEQCQILQHGMCTCKAGTAPLVLNSPALLLTPTMQQAMEAAWHAGKAAALKHGAAAANPYTTEVELPPHYCEGCGLHRNHCDCNEVVPVEVRDCAVCDQMLYRNSTGEWMHCYPNDCTSLYSPMHKQHNQRGCYD